MDVEFLIIKKYNVWRCCFDSIVLFQIVNNVLSRHHDHSLDRYEDATHPSEHLQYILPPSGDPQSVYISILSTHTHLLKILHQRDIFLLLLKMCTYPVRNFNDLLEIRTARATT